MEKPDVMEIHEDVEGNAALADFCATLEHAKVLQAEGKLLGMVLTFEYEAPEEGENQTRVDGTMYGSVLTLQNLSNSLRDRLLDLGEALSEDQPEGRQQ